MKISCPHCNAEIDIDDSYTKTYMQDCISCGQEFKVQIGDVAEPEPEPVEFVIEEPVLPKPIQNASVPRIPEGWVCLKCEMVGKPKKKGGGGKFLLIGWFVICPFSLIMSNAVGEESFLYGLFGGLFTLALFGSPIMGLSIGFKSVTTHCFNCGNSDLIPLQSPKGYEIAEKHGFRF